MSHELDDARVAAMIHAAAAAVRAPDRLRRELAAQRPRRVGRRRSAGAFAAAVATTFAAVLAFAHPAGDRGPLSIVETASVALREPVAPAPARDARAPALLRASADGVRFPNYAYGGLGWRPEGQRHTRRGGRELVVVSYTHGRDAHAGYAIVGRPALRLAAGAATVVRNGVRFAVLRDAGATIVTWRRDGRTCVLASRDASAEALLRIAAWRPDDGLQGPY
jgi:hypothetical protein